jgi:hypothetical protein
MDFRSTPGVNPGQIAPELSRRVVAPYYIAFGAALVPPVRVCRSPTPPANQPEPAFQQFGSAVSMGRPAR